MPPKKHTRLPIGRYKPKKITLRKRKNTETIPLSSEIDICESESDDLHENNLIDDSLEDDSGKLLGNFHYLLLYNDLSSDTEEELSDFLEEDNDC
jgi:hypothetical protein